VLLNRLFLTSVTKRWQLRFQIHQEVIYKFVYFYDIDNQLTEFG